LLPPRSVVHVAWHPRDRRVREPDVFNLLAIPLPYAVM